MAATSTTVPRERERRAGSAVGHTGTEGRVALTPLFGIFTQPVDTMEFSIIVSILIAVLVVGVAALVVGCVLMMPKVGAHWWQGLIPGYNFYRLFRGARAEVLLSAYIIDAAFVFGFFFALEPEYQELVWWPVFIGVFMIQWLALCLAQRMHLNRFWQLLSFVAPSFAWCLIGLLPRRVDPDWYPWAVRPFIRFEHLIWEHPWEYDRSNPRAELVDEDELDDGELDGDDMGDWKFGEEGEPIEADTTVMDLSKVGSAEVEIAEESESDVDGPDEDGFGDESDDLEGTGDHLEDFDDFDDPLDEPSSEDGQPVESAEMGNSVGETPNEGPAMNDDDQRDATAAEPEEPPAEDRYDGDAAYRGHGFDPEGDEAVERADRREPADLSRHVDHILDEEARLFDRRPRSAMRRGRPDDDLSDLVESQIEGVYAEQLGYPGVTQDVDAEEAAYLEENATYARERILEESHDEPDDEGYAGRHLAEAVRKVRREEATDPDWPEPDAEAGQRNADIDGRLPKID